jgi:hypothetical protein
MYNFFPLQTTYTTFQGTIVKYVPSSNSDYDIEDVMIQSTLGSLSTSTTVTDVTASSTVSTDTNGVPDVGQLDNNVVQKVSVCVVVTLLLLITDLTVYTFC